MHGARGKDGRTWGSKEGEPRDRTDHWAGGKPPRLLSAELRFGVNHATKPLSTHQGPESKQSRRAAPTPSR